MPKVAIPKVDDPCQECRDRHLKCDDNNPCKQCSRLEQTCHRTKGKAKFRFGSSARYDTHFARDQVWLGQSKNAELQFVNEGPELENYYSTDDAYLTPIRPASPPRSRTASSTSISRPWFVEARVRSPPRQSITSSESVLSSPTSHSQDETTTPTHVHKRRRTEDFEAQQLPSGSNQTSNQDPDPSRYYVLGNSRQGKNFNNSILTMSPEQQPITMRKVYAEYQRLEDSAAAEVPSEHHLLDPTVWKEHFTWPNNYTTTQCACLMRYYTDHLGPRLDIGDPARHFTLVVPQKARRCPPLLNAIFTIAARHLAGLPQFKTKEGIVRYQNNQMPRLDDRQAIKYQNASLAYLKELCNHPEHVQDEDLLAATVILRYYEEFDTSLGGTTDGSLLRPFQLFIAAQTHPSFVPMHQFSALDYSMPGTFTSIREDIERYLSSYQHASFRIALRQECTRAFMKQEAIGIPLEAWSILEGFDEAEDFVWADRHLYHLAKVLQFCFDRKDRKHYLSADRWKELKDFEDFWAEFKPYSFADIHYKKPNSTLGEALPEIWYLADVHAVATQYFDLSRILLTVYNPALPRLGLGSITAAREMSKKVRELVVQVCGTATSMPGSEPALVLAYMAVALCGEHFTEHMEQKALLGILADLEANHGFPTTSTANSLKQSWNWQ